jgi:hypothetical protein
VCVFNVGGENEEATSRLSRLLDPCWLGDENALKKFYGTGA